MLRRDLFKLIVLVLIPANAWLIVLYFHHHSKVNVAYPSLTRYESESKVRIAYFQEKWHIKEGQRLIYPFPFKGKTFVLRQLPSIGQGEPVLFLNIGWIAYPEVWEPAIQEVLKSSSRIHVVLLYNLTGITEAIELQDQFHQQMRLIQNMLNHFPPQRVSAIASEQMSTVFGLEIGGILAIICDGQGIVKVVEFYPPLKRTPKWHEEVSDWRPKLHQAVKRALEKFFGKPSGKQ
jgi:hypothetical protein